MAKHFRLLLLLAAVVLPAAAQSVLLSVPAVDSEGNSVLTGSAYISWHAFVDNSGVIVPGGSKNVPIVAGRLSVALVASDNAGFVYNVLIQGGRGANGSVFLWRVPAVGASTFAELAAPLPSHDNAIGLNLTSMICGPPVDGVLRRVPSASGEQLQACLSSYSGWWKALSSALKNAQTQVVRVRVFGDSMSRCWGPAGAASGVNCPGVGPTTNAALWIEQLRAFLNAAYPSHGSGFLPFAHGIDAVAGGEYALSGAGSPNYFPALVPNQGGTQANGSLGVELKNGQSLTEIVGHAGDTLQLAYVAYTYSGGGSGGGFDVSIDGQALGRFGSEAAPALEGKTLSFPVPAAAATHKFAVTCQSDSCYLYGAEWTIGTAGVSLDNFAGSACRSECFNRADKLYFPSLWAAGSTNFDLFFLGTNDYFHGATVSQYASDLGALVANEKSIGVKSILIASEPWLSAAGSAVAPQGDFFAAARALASAQHVDYFDLPGTPSFPNAAAESGFLEDGIHMNDAGHAAIWSAMQRYLIATSFSWYQVPLGDAVGTH